MLQLLEELTRRDFNRYVLLCSGAKAIDLVFNSPAFAQADLSRFSRKSPFNLENEKWIEIDDTKKGYVLTLDEENQSLEEIAKRQHLRGKQGKRKSTEIILSVRPEPDRNYATNLIQEAQIATDNLFKFLVYLAKPNISYVVPKIKEDIKIKNLSSNIMYLVSGLRIHVTSTYEFELEQGKINEPVILTRNGQGVTYGLINLIRGKDDRHAKLELNFPAIFYNTSATTPMLIEVPAIEALHIAMGPYTYQNMVREIRLQNNLTYRDLVRIHTKWSAFDERFVHALSILWLQKYIKERSFGLETQFKRRFESYENSSVYRGTNQLARYIENIGVQRAIELYIHNPNELFKVLK